MMTYFVMEQMKSERNQLPIVYKFESSLKCFLSQFAIKVSSKKMNLTFDNSEISGPVQAAFCFGYLLVTLGSLLYAGIIHFEHYGGDPQKRTFTNKMFAKQCLAFIIEDTAIMTLVLFRVFCGPLGHWAGLLATTFICCPLFAAMAMIEILIFKIVQVCNFRLSNRINEDFLTVFLTLFNFMFVSLALFSELFVTSSYVPVYAVVSGNLTSFTRIPR